MAPVLGKRKRRKRLTDDTSVFSPLPDCQAQALLKQHFEATFEPLPVLENVLSALPQNEDESDQHLEGSDWEGISDGERDHAKLVQYTTSKSAKAEVSKNEMKAFMTSKPPTSKAQSTFTENRKNAPKNGSDEADDSADLKKDLALQRLLKESHLLDSISSLSHTGQNRHKALDLRLRDMGSRSSIFSQPRMPIAQRKGIMAKAVTREEARRREAQENGIVLEKASRTKRLVDVKRHRSIGAPAVGKFRGGTLRLSKKDVAEIQGSNKTSQGRR
ncbi:MAG: hypothetical protein Q9217_006298 [Psora testacea]